MDGNRILDLAWQLATHQLPNGSPMVLQREAEIRIYIYFLVVTNTRAYWLRRLIRASLDLRVDSELELIRRQQRVLQLGCAEGVAPAEIMDAILAEQKWREFCWFGQELSEKSRGVFHALGDRAHRSRLIQLIRRGQVKEKTGGFEFEGEACRKFGTDLLSVSLFAWLMWILYSIRDHISDNGFFTPIFIAASIVCCAGIAITFRASIKEARSAIDAANAVLRPRRVS